MINTNGLKMTGLRKAAGETKNLRGYYDASYLQLNYDTVTGEVWTDYFCSLGQNSWTEYHDAAVKVIGNIHTPKTMQELADMISAAIEDCE